MSNYGEALVDLMCHAPGCDNWVAVKPGTTEPYAYCATHLDLGYGNQIPAEAPQMPQERR
jgi:hypothetical protein